MAQKNKANRKAKQARQTAQRPTRPKRRLDYTKVVAVFIGTLVIFVGLWIFNPGRLFAAVCIFVSGVVYGLLLPYMIHRMVHH